MRVKPIVHPLAGEHVVGVHPTMTPDVKTEWNRRLNLYTGRALSDSALATEQQMRGGRLALRGQMVSPGVVAGLEVGVERGSAAKSGAPLEGFFCQIAPGFGVTAAGEDVVLSRPLRVGLGDVSVYAPVRLLDAPLRSTPRPRPQRDGEVLMEERERAREVGLDRVESSRALPVSEELRAQPGGRRLEVRRAGGPLGELIAAGRAAELPRVGVLVLQPIVAELVGEYDDEDPCEEDPANYAFEDWQLADGFRLVFYAWPTEWEPLPMQGERWRNRIAYAVFNAERRHAPDEPLPWEEIGVPIALVAFDDAWAFQFIDRYTVVRAGGKPKRRTPLLLEAGHPFLWQARVQQLAEHLADDELDGLSARDLARHFRYLPPVGILPANLVDFLTGDEALKAETRVRGSSFFPASYHITVAPVPLEQLDIAVEASAALKPFDIFTRDQVEVLVPV
ncbi:MAG TPA: hypothetical protein VF754_10705, partial [Pyrinomonadaceae bacterium]